MKFKTASLRELFQIDLRSLAFFRMGLALVILADLAVRASDLRMHYCDEGVLPRVDLISRIFPGSPFWSIHLSNGPAVGQGILFALQAIFAVGLLVGYRTRTMAFLVWLFLVSLHMRNRFILQDGDTL